MPRIKGPRKVHQYSNEFKVTAVRLSHKPPPKKLTPPTNETEVSNVKNQAVVLVVVNRQE